MTTTYNPAEVERLIERARTRYAKFGAVATADAMDMADQLDAARARIRELEAEVDRAAALLEASSDRAARKVWAASLRETLTKSTVLP